MAVQRFKLGLNNAKYPMTARKAQRAVFIPGLDSAPRTPRTYMGNTVNIDYDTAQVIYAENVMPVAEGIRSVGYKELISPSQYVDFDQVISLRDENENSVLFSPARGKNYVYDSSTNSWIPNTFAGVPAGTAARVTYAYVDGKTFVCYAGIGIFSWNGTTKTFSPAGTLIANLPFADSAIDGVSSSSGYLVVWSSITVAWAPFNGAAFDFTPYLNGNFTGAGNQIPEEVKGSIQAILQVSGGLIIFTTKNAIAAHYHSQNIAAPWVFREIAGAGGIRSYEQATVESNLGSVTAYTTAGFQTLNLNSSTHQHPDVSDFITGRSFDYYEAGQLLTTTSGTDLAVKVTVIGQRYVALSYGFVDGIYSFALIWDIALERWGRLRCKHVDLFYWVQQQETGDVTYGQLIDVTYQDLLDRDISYEEVNTLTGNLPQSNARHSLALLRSDGSVAGAVWSDDIRSTEDPAIAIIGRVQLSRTRRTQFQRAEIEGMTSGRAYIQPSYDGRTLAETQQLYTVAQAEDLLVVGGLYDCVNFNIMLEGTFSVSTVILEGTTSGSY